jgi:hypothetical protein
MERDLGEQPISALMVSLGLNNHDLVAASEEQLTHKMVAKARRGRWMTMRLRLKVLRALNNATGREYALADLFNYS